MEGKMKVFFSTLLLGLLCAGFVFADVADFDNEPYSAGIYIQGYPMFSTASNYYDANGDKQSFTDSWNAYGFMLRPTYYGRMGERR